MSSRLLDLCLLAYPRAQRRRDGRFLRDLASDLAADRGLARQAASLVLGGAVARIERARGRATPARRALAGGIAAAALAGVALIGGLTAVASEPEHLEEDVFACGTGPDACAQVAMSVQARERDGWTCEERRDASTAGTWRCTLERS